MPSKRSPGLVLDLIIHIGGAYGGHLCNIMIYSGNGIMLDGVVSIIPRGSSHLLGKSYPISENRGYIYICRMNHKVANDYLSIIIA